MNRNDHKWNLQSKLQPLLFCCGNPSFDSVQFEYLCNAIKQDVALRPGSNIKTNTF